MIVNSQRFGKLLGRRDIMKKKTFVSLIVIAVWMFVLSANAGASAWRIDQAHSSIHFTIKHIYSNVNGHFGDFEGQIVFDPDNLDRSRFDFSVTVKSIDTNNSKRDNHLLSGDFFDAGKYPTMTFKSASIKHVKGDQYTVEGTLAIKDVSQTVTVPFTYFGNKPNPFNPKQLVSGFEARMTIDRMAYHVGNGKFLEMGVVGKEVDIVISIEATRES